jgi:hypothetical protein
VLRRPVETTGSSRKCRVVGDHRPRECAPDDGLSLDYLVGERHQIWRQAGNATSATQKRRNCFVALLLARPSEGPVNILSG